MIKKNGDVQVENVESQPCQECNAVVGEPCRDYCTARPEGSSFVSYTYTELQAKLIIDRYNARVKPDFAVTVPHVLFDSDNFDENLMINGHEDVEVSAHHSLSGHTELVTYYVSDFEPLKGSE